MGSELKGNASGVFHAKCVALFVNTLRAKGVSQRPSHLSQTASMFLFSGLTPDKLLSA